MEPASLEALRALAFSVWAALAPPDYRAPDAPAVADAIAAAVSEDALPPVFGSRRDDAATMAVYAFAESGVHEHPRPVSWDARAGRSCGVFQEPCRFVRSHSLLDQARYWLAFMRAARRVCPANPGAVYVGGCGSRSAWRQATWRRWKARRLLAAFESQQAAEERMARE